MDLNDAHSIRDTVIDIQPDYFINFAAQSFVAGSWDYPIQTWDTDADAVLHILESIRRFASNCKFYNAGSSEEFGDVICSSLKTKIILLDRKAHMALQNAQLDILLEFTENPTTCMQFKVGYLITKGQEED